MTVPAFKRGTSEVEGRLLDAALAELLGVYFHCAAEPLGPRYRRMRDVWSDAGGEAFAGGAPAVYIGDGPCTSLHIDIGDTPLFAPTLPPDDDRTPGCSVLLRVDWDATMRSPLLEAIDRHVPSTPPRRPAPRAVPRGAAPPPRDPGRMVLLGL